MKKSLGILGAVLWFASAGAMAQVKMSGDFVAAKSCPALQSIKKGTNPGDVSVAAGTHYAVKGKNRDQASHYWITVPGANPPERWVAADCGAVDGAVVVAAPAPANTKSKPPSPQTQGGPFYVLALSWEPAFCEGLPNKAECKSQTADRADAKQFSLHGLWPQPRRNVFCGVAQKDVDADDQHRWEDLPKPDLSAATKAALDAVMPGTASILERHEWIKHGTCYPVKSADRYFADAVKLTQGVNASAVGAFMAANVGKDMNSADLLAKFDEAFFVGAGSRVRVSCKPDGNRQLITEITIGLKGDIPAGTSLADLMKASAPTDPGCPHGVLDMVGLQ
jgi:ribonuclease T2